MIDGVGSSANKERSVAAMLSISRFRPNIALLGPGVLLALPAYSSAQNVKPTTEEMVRCFAIEYTVGADRGACKDLVPGAVAVLFRPLEYGDYVDGVIDGLAELAVSHPEFRVRVAAAEYLMAPGRQDPSSEYLPGMVDRVQRVYEESTEPAIRSILIGWMPVQAETEAAVDFLRKVATSDKSPAGRMWPDEQLAIDALSRMGDRGRQVLRQLDESGQVRNELARQRLDYLRTRDYRPEPSSHGRQ